MMSFKILSVPLRHELAMYITVKDLWCYYCYKVSTGL